MRVSGVAGAECSCLAIMTFLLSQLTSRLIRALELPSVCLQTPHVSISFNILTTLVDSGS